MTAALLCIISVKQLQYTALRHLNQEPNQNFCIAQLGQIMREIRCSSLKCFVIIQIVHKAPVFQQQQAIIPEVDNMLLLP